MPASYKSQQPSSAQIWHSLQQNSYQKCDSVCISGKRNLALGIGEGGSAMLHPQKLLSRFPFPWRAIIFEWCAIALFILLSVYVIVFFI